jgi:hypothetical protein
MISNMVVSQSASQHRRGSYDEAVGNQCGSLATSSLPHLSAQTYMLMVHIRTVHESVCKYQKRAWRTSALAFTARFVLSTPQRENIDRFFHDTRP